MMLKEWFEDCDCVCFDVDSTVCVDEGIDVLADVCGVGKEVADWTARAMGGGVTFQEALGARLDIMKPSRQSIEKCLKERPSQLTDGMKDFVNVLQSRGVSVYLVSGGFRQMIEPVAEILNIPFDNIFANNLLFHEDGGYKGFDENEPTSRSGGKPKVIRTLKDRHGYKKIIIIGDGVTDMEARPPADLFIGFGGNVVREKVKAGADVFLTSFSEVYVNE
eukprot:Nk52_evm1s545 gene=Nk52_evmTU1s545